MTILGISGSLQRQSTNAALLLIASRVVPPDADLQVSEELKAAHARGHLWLALADHHPVGFAHVKVLEPTVAHLEEIDVHPDHARRGLGTRLVMAVCAWAATARYREVTLTTFRDVYLSTCPSTRDWDSKRSPLGNSVLCCVRSSRTKPVEGWIPHVAWPCAVRCVEARSALGWDCRFEHGCPRHRVIMHAECGGHVEMLAGHRRHGFTDLLREEHEALPDGEEIAE